jgi:hypothetical protein
MELLADSSFIKSSRNDGATATQAHQDDISMNESLVQQRTCFCFVYDFKLAGKAAQWNKTTAPVNRTLQTNRTEKRKPFRILIFFPHF